MRHQLDSLPEVVEIAGLTSNRTELDNQARDAQILVDDLTAEQNKADADVEQVKTRRERDRSRIDAGLITNPKDLERMQHELVSLERRITSLEDTELEVMERLEEAQNTLDSVTALLATTDDRLTALAKIRDEKAGDLEVSLSALVAERSQAVSGMPEDLMKLYEHLRVQRGVGAAPLQARQCGGCQLTLNSMDLAAIAKAPSDEVLRCEECSRILVRTSESGL